MRDDRLQWNKVTLGDEVQMTASAIDFNVIGTVVGKRTAGEVGGLIRGFLDVQAVVSGIRITTTFEADTPENDTMSTYWYLRLKDKTSNSVYAVQAYKDRSRLRARVRAELGPTPEVDDWIEMAWI